MIKFKEIFWDNNAIALLIDPKTGSIFDANPSAQAFYQYKHAEICLLNINALNVNSTSSEVEKQLKSVQNPTLFDGDYWHQLKDGTMRFVKIMVSSITYQELNLSLAIIQDITELKQAELKNRKIQRFKDFTIEINDLILHADHPKDIIDGICQIAVSSGGFLFSRVSKIDSIKNEISDVAFAGYEAGYLKELKLTTEESSIFSHGPTGVAYRTKRFSYSNDIANDPIMAPWRESALKRGYKSSISMPIVINGKVDYVFAIYCDSINYFDEEELSLLERIAKNIAFSLQTINIRSEKEILNNIIEKTQAFVVINDLDLNLIYANAAFRNAMGITKEVPLEKINLRNLVRFKSNNSRSNKVLDSLAKKGSWTGEGVFYDNKGTEFKVLEVVEINYDNNRVPINMFTTAIDISESKAIEKQKKSNKLKSEFLTFVSHEIRTPLASISSSCELMGMYLNKLDGNIEQKLRKCLSNIDFEIDGLSSMLNEILTLDKIESGNLAQQKKQFDISKAVEIIIRSTIDRCGDDRNVELNIHGNQKDMFADELYFNHIIENLISNALKYSIGKPAPTVNISYEGNHVDIFIKDFGIGIPKEDQQNLFSTFFRASNTSGIKGTGVGLSIVNNFVKLLKGEIFIESQEGEFTNVHLKLPYK